MIQFDLKSIYNKYFLLMQIKNKKINKQDIYKKYYINLYNYFYKKLTISKIKLLRVLI